jgi:hypothetical protein
MNSKELAKQFKVTRRTAQRWIKVGAPVDDPEKMAIWIGEHQSHFGRSKFESGEPSAAARDMAAVAFPPALELTDTDYDFTSTDRLIGNLSALATRAMRDLEAARLSGSSKAIALSSRVFKDAIYELRQALVQRDQLAASAGASYSAEEIAFVAAQIFMGIRHLLTDQFPAAAEQAAWDKDLVDLKNRVLLESVIRDVIQTVVFPCLCDTGAHMASMMAKARKVSTVAQRRDLFSAITAAWTLDEFQGAE